MVPLSRVELYAFHNIDRQMFSRLVKDFGRDRVESLLVIAMWLWLELQGFRNIIVKLVRLPDILVHPVVFEAALSLNCLENPQLNAIPHGTGVLPATSRVLGRQLSLRYFQENRFSAVSGMRSILTNVCARAFTDILEDVMGNTMQLDQPILVSHRLIGDLVIVPRPSDQNLPSGDIWAWDPAQDADECDRTVFLTFSRGFPVSEEEVRALFTEQFGVNTVSKVIMQEPAAPSEQSLFAKLVVTSVALVDRVLDGKKVAKFHANGKHIWARKYERR